MVHRSPLLSLGKRKVVVDSYRWSRNLERNFYTANNFRIVSQFLLVPRFFGETLEIFPI